MTGYSIGDLQHEWLGEEPERCHALTIGSADVSLVFFPALGDTASSYARVLPALLTALNGRVRLVAVDPPGYGRSIRKHGSIPSFSELMAWARRLCDGMGAVIALGNSSGGAMATAAAASTTGRAQGLVLIGWPDWRVAEMPFDTLVPSDIRSLERLLEHSWHAPPTLHPQMAQISLERYRSAAFREHVHSLDADEYLGRYDQYQGPLMFIGGHSDQLVSRQALTKSAERRPGAGLRIIPECGHFPHKEQADELVNALAEFAAPLISWSERGGR